MGVRNNIYDNFVGHEGSPDSKLWIVGESPGEDEEINKRPFVGMSGQLLRDTLQRHGIKESECFFANLSHYRPIGNQFHHLLRSKELEQGKFELEALLFKYKPNLILALGGYPYNFFTGKCENGVGITKWRGSVIPCVHNAEIKVLGTYHPAYVSRNESYFPMLDFDISRASKEKEYSDIRHKYKREFVIDPRGIDLIRWTDYLLNSKKIAVDIESIKGTTTILCVGFSPTPETAIVIPFRDGERTAAIRRILESDSKKCFHFGTYDINVLWVNGIEVKNYAWDTLIAQHILNPELPRGLDFVVSVYTDEQYYKVDGRGEIPDDVKVWSANTDPNKLYIYNAKDCCYTKEVWEEQEKEMERDEAQMDMFLYEMSLQEPAFEIMRNGLTPDHDRIKMIERACLVRWSKTQTTLNMFAEKDVNVNSPKQMKELIFTQLALPLKKNKDGKLTTDENAIVSLITFVSGKIAEYKTKEKKDEWKIKLIILKCVLAIRGIRKLLSSYVLIKPSTDGKIHSTVTVAGPETGRFSMSKYVDGTGVNAQTFPRDSIEIPEDLIQVDSMINMVEDLTNEIEDKEGEEWT